MGRTACTDPQCLCNGTLYLSVFVPNCIFHYLFCVALVLLMSQLVIFLVFSLCRIFHFLSTPQDKTLNNIFLAFIILVCGVFLKKYLQFRAANHKKNNTKYLGAFHIFSASEVHITYVPTLGLVLLYPFGLFGLYTFKMHRPQCNEIFFFF